MNSNELAWLAGLLEGEGYFIRQTTARGHVRIGLGVTSTDRDVLEKLQSLVPTSRLQGPYAPTKTGLGTKRHWRWQFNARGLVVELAEQLRPLMGERRQGQIDAMLAHQAAHPAMRNRSPSPAAHGTRTRYGRGCHCESCHAAETLISESGARSAGRREQPRGWSITCFRHSW